MMTFKYKLARRPALRHLDEEITAFGEVWNHFIRLMQRYYRRYDKRPSLGKLKRHLTKCKHRTHTHWQALPSQALQDVLERMDRGYNAFFKGHIDRLPGTKDPAYYSSYTLKQSGWTLTAKHVRLGQRWFRFFPSRPLRGTVKIITVSRDRAKDFWISVVTDATPPKQTPRRPPRTAVGLCFDLQRFIVLSSGEEVAGPAFYAAVADRIDHLTRVMKQKERGSGNYERVRLQRARLHRKVARQRTDFHWRTAHQLCDRFDRIHVQEMDLRALAAEHGEDVSERGIYLFLCKLELVAAKKDTLIVRVPPEEDPRGADDCTLTAQEVATKTLSFG